MSKGVRALLITDNAGTVTNTYDAVGNLLSVRDPVGNTSTMSYDIRGRKTSMQDPDMGYWTYAYNAFGELLTQRDARGQTATMTYDVLGRMKTRVNVEGTSTWNYDGCTKGIGKLCSVTGFGVSEYQYYDGLGRPYQNWSYIAGTWYALTTGFDAFSRPLTLQYPTGFRTRNVYDGYGHLCEVWSDSLSTTPAPATCGTPPPASGNERFWQANTHQSAQGLTQETYGNGMVTNYTYDPASQDLTRIVTVDSDGYTERDLTFDFDAPGNLMSRSWWDGAATRTESFGYDALNRLTQVTGPASKSATYNAIGNLLTKSDVGAYTYPAAGSARPHAVASIAGAVNTSFTYDANGNTLTGNGKTYTWTSFNKVKTATKGATTATFSYGPHYERRVKVSGPDTTHYVGKLYERLTSGTFTSHQHYVHAGNSLIGVYRTRSSGSPFMSYYFADHLGSIDTVTGDYGNVAARFSFDAWGRSRNPDGTDNPSASTDFKGFTRHEHDDDIGLINMNAREYDPQIARFVSADTIVGNNVPSQALNRYDYANNNPLSFVDPSGNLSKKWKKRLRKWAKKAWEVYAKQTVGAAYAVAGFFTGGPAGAVAGAYMGYNSIRAYEKGVPTDDILRGNVRGYAAMYFGTKTSTYIGDSIPTTSPTLIAANAGAHALAGGAASEIAGGDFRSGALSGGFGALASPYVPQNLFWGSLAAGAVGCGAAAAGGGQCNGTTFAIAGIGHAFNFLAHPKEGTLGPNQAAGCAANCRYPDLKNFGDSNYGFEINANISEGTLARLSIASSVIAFGCPECALGIWAGRVALASDLASVVAYQDRGAAIGIPAEFGSQWAVTEIWGSRTGGVRVGIAASLFFDAQAGDQ